MKEHDVFDDARLYFDKMTDPDRQALVYHVASLMDLFHKCFPDHEDRLYTAIEMLFPGLFDFEIPAK